MNNKFYFLRNYFFFENIPKIHRKLKTIKDVGLGYITLGQQSTTLSGGEAQRIKLATELSKKDTGQTLYILDEPTTGLHFEDIRVLMKVLNRLVDKGNTMIIIEHNMDFILRQGVLRLVVMKEGEILMIGTPDEVRSNRAVIEAYLGAVGDESEEGGEKE